MTYNWLQLNRRQVVIWTNGCLIYRFLHSSIGLGDLVCIISNKVSDFFNLDVRWHYTSPCHMPATHTDARQTSTSTGPPRLADAPDPMGAEHRASPSQADPCPSVRPSSEAPVLEDPTVVEASPSPPAPPPASSPRPCVAQGLYHGWQVT